MNKKIVLIFAIALLTIMVLPACSSDEVNIAPVTDIVVGTWSAEEHNVTTHLYQDGTGRTENDDGIHEFTWEVMSLAEATRQRNEHLTELSYWRNTFEQQGKSEQEIEDWIIDSEKRYNEFALLDIFSHTHTLFTYIEDSGLLWGIYAPDVEMDEHGNVTNLDEWDIEGYVLILDFGNPYRLFDFAFYFDGQDALRVNSMILGRLLSLQPNVYNRFEWITFNRA